MANKAGIIKEIASNPGLSPSFPQLLKIRILVLIKGIWRVDPPPDKLTEKDKEWIYNNKSLVDLQWDPAEFAWKGQYEQHSVKLGKILLSENEQVTPAAEKWWVEYGIHNDLRRELLKEL